MPGTLFFKDQVESAELQLLRGKIDAGLKAAVAAALDEHRRAGRLVPTWRNGKIVHVLPPPPASDSLSLREDAPAPPPEK